jgi:hypothetical protein
MLEAGKKMRGDETFTNVYEGAILLGQQLRPFWGGFPLLRFQPLDAINSAITVYV